MSSSQAGHVVCLVDSDIAIDDLRRRSYAGKLLERWSFAGLLAVSTVAHLEIYHGIKPGEEEATRGFLDGLVSVPVDVSVTRQAGTMLAGLRSTRTTIGPIDAIIAAAALELDVPLLTKNTGHYPFGGLKIVRGMEP